MAQTKRKRRSKHRGNAAGSVEARGRTGGKVAPAKGGKGAVRLDRLDQPPTWRSAANRSAIATVLFVIVITLLQHNLPAALVIGVLMFPAYTGLGFYTDKRIYERRQAKKAAGKS